MLFLKSGTVSGRFFYEIDRETSPCFPTIMYFRKYRNVPAK
ncbi:hypothetical protein [Mucilaginibacter sp.]|nr:hypothetical protein [Mucilaginibacter sp.]MDR3695589.1 hypothetical protein [Mucilaginibacter sp.]